MWTGNSVPGGGNSLCKGLKTRGPEQARSRSCGRGRSGGARARLGPAGGLGSEAGLQSWLLWKEGRSGQESRIPDGKGTVRVQRGAVRAGGGSGWVWRWPGRQPPCTLCQPPAPGGLGVAASGVLLLHTATRGRQRPGFEAFLGEEVAGLPWCQSWLCRARVQRTLLPRSRGHLGPWAHPGSSQSEALEGGSLT